MAMRAVPINAVPAEAFVVPSNVMGPPKALPVAKVQEPENLGVDESAAARGSRTATSSEGAHRQEVEARETIQADNSKKRKADGEARQSPEVATAVAGIAGKRRASPEAQVQSASHSRFCNTGLLYSSETQVHAGNWRDLLATCLSSLFACNKRASTSILALTTACKQS